ncbi:DUF5615 family PIN-like protein [Rhizobium mongolense]|uniref:DUF5615 family PIN-like protein n=1 Tax=Rhizobium mongolense TaxID=57676 RepID=UPI0035581220
MKFLVDECLHTSLVAVAQHHGHDCFHVNWLGLSGETDWDLMPRIVAEDFTFVTNNARDFRKLYAREALHAGLAIIVAQVLPRQQRELFALVLQELADSPDLVNEVVEIALEEDEVLLTLCAARVKVNFRQLGQIDPTRVLLCLHGCCSVTDVPAALTLSCRL